MLKIILGETLGTFFFLSVILATTSTKEVLAPLLIGLALTVAIYFCSKSSLGALNPAAAIALYLRGDIKLQVMFVYIISEVVGAILAFLWWMMTLSSYKHKK
jgi:glycerol uptake facilitator-like aquaporin